MSNRSPSPSYDSCIYPQVSWAGRREGRVEQPSPGEDRRREFDAGTARAERNGPPGLE